MKIYNVIESNGEYDSFYREVIETWYSLKQAEESINNHKLENKENYYIIETVEIKGVPTKDYKLFRELRKKDKTELTLEDKILLNYKSILCYICECLVSESKMELSKEDCIEMIRDALSKML